MNSKFAGLEIAVDQPQRMTLVHPISRQPLRDADGETAWIEIYSNDSSAARKHNREVQRRRLAMRGRGRITPEEVEAEGIDLLAALTTNWRLLTLDGTPLDVPFSPEAARELYSAQALAWVREQVDEFCVDRANFPQPSSTS